MPWTAPITWADEVIYDADDLNEQLRDNLEILKVSRADNGKVSGFSSDAFADLSGANIVGATIARSASDNVYSGKVSLAAGNGRLVIPEITDAEALTTGPGCLFFNTVLSSGNMKWVSETSTIRRATTAADIIVTENAVPYSLWVNGNNLYLAVASTAAIQWAVTLVGTVAGRVQGSIWVEGETLRYIGSAGREYQVVSA